MVADRDLRGLESTWRQVIETDPDATVFQTWEWVSAWWRFFGGSRRPMVLVAHGPDGPVALAPLALRAGPAGLFRRVEFMGTGVSDYLGFIGPPEAMAECARAFVGFLLQTSGWDVVDFQQLNPAHASRCAWAAPPERGSLPTAGARLTEQAICPVMALPATWDEALQRVGKKMRSNIRYYERLLEREFAVSYEVADEATVGPALEDFLRLHAQRWRRRGLPGAVYSRRLGEFHRSVAPALARAGYLALHRMMVDGKCVAALYCFRYGARVFYYLGGFDPALGRYSPGTVLTARAIRSAIESGCREFDFLRGREEYKYRWPVEERPNRRMEVPWPGSARSRLGLRWNLLQQQLQDYAQGALHKA